MTHCFFSRPVDRHDEEGISVCSGACEAMASIKEDNQFRGNRDFTVNIGNRERVCIYRDNVPRKQDHLRWKSQDSASAQPPGMPQILTPRDPGNKSSAPKHFPPMVCISYTPSFMFVNLIYKGR